jgi:hypothetical protein
MKYFIEPQGKFTIKIPIEWQYKNIAVGHAETSPFSFELYKDSVGAFQISCYSNKEKPIGKRLPVQKADIDHLEFFHIRNDDREFCIHLWYAIVEDHLLMAKYIYDVSEEHSPTIINELQKVEKSLSSLIFLSPEHRIYAIEQDKYQKFITSLSASFDLLNKAIKNGSNIELLILIANQIDAYLRMAIVFKKQLKQQTNRIDIPLLYQDEKDSPIMERKIYAQAKEFGIIDTSTFDKLETLYKGRNKVVHRYIITDFKTRDLFKIVYDYACISETIRIALKAIEDEQIQMGIGIYSKVTGNDNAPSEKQIQVLFSWVNDKHLIDELYRKINT